jgi:tetratricopeptide (TPR) repeat protein
MDTYGLLCSRAEAAYRTGRIDEAIRLYEEAIDGGLDRPAAYKTLGQLYLSARQYEAAAGWFQRAARTMPISTELLDHWVWALLGQGRIDRAKQVIAQALTVPSSTRSLNPLAKALHGEDLGSLRLVADTLFEAGQLGLAREYYQKVAEIQPTSFVFGRLGHVCRFMGAMSAAAEYLRMALELEPENAESLANLDRKSVV